VQNTNSQYNLPPLPQKLSFAGNRDEDELVGRFAHVSTQASIRADLQLTTAYDEQIRTLELHLTRHAKVDDPVTYQLLRTVPGIGPVLALILLYEVHDIRRFPEAGHFLSDCRLVRCEHESGGKVKGYGSRKIGNGHLRWALGEAACLLLRCHEPAKAWLKRQQKKGPKARALGVLAAKIARTVYHLGRKQVAFDGKRFLTSSEEPAGSGVGSWTPNWGPPGATAEAGNRGCGADRARFPLRRRPRPHWSWIGPPPRPGL
jgi:hypothetical protein